MISTFTLFFAINATVGVARVRFLRAASNSITTKSLYKKRPRFLRRRFAKSDLSAVTLSKCYNKQKLLVNTLSGT